MSSSVLDQKRWLSFLNFSTSLSISCKHPSKSDGSRLAAFFAGDPLAKFDAVPGVGTWRMLTAGGGDVTAGNVVCEALKLPKLIAGLGRASGRGALDLGRSELCICPILSAKRCLDSCKRSLKDLFSIPFTSTLWNQVPVHDMEHVLLKCPSGSDQTEVCRNGGRFKKVQEI
jgi:hypothetical protein